MRVHKCKSYLGGKVVGPFMHWSPINRITNLNDDSAFCFTPSEHSSVVTPDTFLSVGYLDSEIKSNFNMKDRHQIETDLVWKSSSLNWWILKTDILYVHNEYIRADVIQITSPCQVFGYSLTQPFDTFQSKIWSTVWCFWKGREKKGIDNIMWIFCYLRSTFGL